MSIDTDPRHARPAPQGDPVRDWVEPEIRHGDGDRPRSGNNWLLLGALAASAGAAAYYGWRTVRDGSGRGPLVSDAPRRALRRRYAEAEARGVIVGRTVTINRPRSELYAYWRDFSHLPRFMENVESVEVVDPKRSRWTIAAPAGREVTFTANITEDRPNELIAWESDEDASVRNSGRIAFRDAPGGRGTEVEAEIAYAPPGGEAGRMIAKIFQREPAIQARRDLKRFKQLMEAGEIATAEPGAAAPRA